MENVFENELIKDEKILWTGKPNPEILFTSADIFLVPFSLMWGGFALFWEASVLGIGFLSEKSSSTPFIPFALFGIPFVLIGLYFIFGRFFYKKWKKGNMYYAVTNKRILIITQTMNKNIQAEYIDRIPAINYSQNKNGTGTIKFGNANFMMGMYDNTGLDFFSSFYGKATPTFFDIDKSKEVYDLVNKLRNE